MYTYQPVSLVHLPWMVQAGQLIAAGKGVYGFGVRIMFKHGSASGTHVGSARSSGDGDGGWIVT